MKVYAVAENVPEGCDYLTAGKRYLIRRQTSDGFFDIESDEGHIIECRWLNSSRLGGADWTRIDEPTPSQTVSQDRAVEAELLVEALQFYADESGWNQPPIQTVAHELLGPAYQNQASKVRLDRGHIARTALAAFKKSEV